MVEYDKVNVNLSESQLNKPKFAVKNETGVTLRMSMKQFNGNELHNEILWTAAQKN